MEAVATGDEVALQRLVLALLSKADDGPFAVEAVARKPAGRRTTASP